MKVVLIEWVDTSTTSGWISRHEGSNVERVSSIGFLVHEDERVVKIAGSLANSGNMADVTTIPKVLITKRKTLQLTAPAARAPR